MKWNPHLTFDGSCEEAFRVYERCLGARLRMMFTYGSSPMAKDVPADFQDKIIFAVMALGELTISGGDLPPGQYRRPQGISIMLSIPEVAEAERIFRNIAAEGVVQMPLHENFWALRFGMVLDRFGISWTVNCLNPAIQKPPPLGSSSR